MSGSRFVKARNGAVLCWRSSHEGYGIASRRAVEQFSKDEQELHEQWSILRPQSHEDISTLQQRWRLPTMSQNAMVAGAVINDCIVPQKTCPG